MNRADLNISTSIVQQRNWTNGESDGEDERDQSRYEVDQGASAGIASTHRRTKGFSVKGLNDCLKKHVRLLAVRAVGHRVDEGVEHEDLNAATDVCLIVHSKTYLSAVRTLNTASSGRSAGGSANWYRRAERDHPTAIGTRTGDAVGRRLADQKAVARATHVLLAGRRGTDWRSFVALMAAHNVLAGTAFQRDFRLANATSHRGT